MDWESLKTAGVLKEVEITDGSVKFVTNKNTKWQFTPYGDCCAQVYVHDPHSAQEEFDYLIGSKILDTTVNSLSLDSSDFDNIESRDVHFYTLVTDKGSATITLYVDHNGYYGGSLQGGIVS